MGHWKKFMDKELLGAHDLDNRDVTVVILEVTGAELNNGTKKNKKPVATIGSRDGRRLEKKLALNATNCKVLEQLAGSPDVDKWRGMAVVLFPTTTNFGGATVECVRIRPYPPKEKEKSNGKGSKAAAASNGDDLTDRIADEMAKNGAVVPRDTEGDDGNVATEEPSNA